MRLSAFDLSKLFVVALAAAAAIYPDKILTTAAFVVVWVEIIISLALVSFYLARCFRDDIDTVAYMRQLADEEETPIKDTIELLVTLAVLLLNSWWLTAVFYLSLEVGSLVIIKLVRLFVAKIDSLGRIRR